MSSRVTISGDGLDHIGGGVSGGRSNQSSSQRRQRSRWVIFFMRKFNVFILKWKIFLHSLHTFNSAANFYVDKINYMNHKSDVISLNQIIVVITSFLLYFNLKVRFTRKYVSFDFKKFSTNTGFVWRNRICRISE